MTELKITYCSVADITINPRNARTHIHQILTNPIYAGRIRHKGQVHEGQHDAIIAPGRWDVIQASLQDGAARIRKAGPRSKRKTQPSLLTGKLFDEAGDRLTPSHSRSKTGTRLRYYISHRLITKSGDANIDGWRLPATELEGTVEHLIRDQLGREDAVLKIIPDFAVGEVLALNDRLGIITASKHAKDILELAMRVDLALGAITITLNPAPLARCIGVDQDRITGDLAPIQAPFRIRKRGVETKIILNGAVRPVDEVLLGNIAKAHAWYGMIRSGKTFADISRETGISKRRIQQMLDLAFLAPDLLREVMEGRQSLGFTSDWCLRHDLPSDWQAQRHLIATL